MNLSRGLFWISLVGLLYGLLPELLVYRFYVSVGLGIMLFIYYRKLKGHYFRQLAYRLWQQDSAYRPKVLITSKLLRIEDVEFKRLMAEFPTPVFIFATRALRERFFKVKDFLNREWPNYELAYSLKTNNVLGICQEMRRMGVSAEVVSAYEYHLALKAGFTKDKIIFNGPNKEVDFSDSGFGELRVHINDHSELQRLISGPRNRMGELLVGLRVRVGNTARPSRFGMELFSKELDESLRKLIAVDGMKLMGLHIHLGSNITDLSEFERAGVQMSRFVMSRKSLLGPEFSYIDWGGGFPVVGSTNIDLRFKPTTFTDYLKPAIEAMRVIGKSNLKAIFEPGRLLIDESMGLVVRVIRSEMKHNQQIVTCDGSKQIFPLGRGRIQRIKVMKYFSPGGRRYETKLLGASCIEDDVLAEGVMMDKVFEGDNLLLYNAGAYNMALSSPFIYPRPGLVGLEDGKMRIFRRPESFNDLTRLDAMMAIPKTKD